MALFKTFRGKRADLGAQELRDGFAYFCTDDGTFHIDFLDTDGKVKRKQINAKDAETLLGHSIEEFLLASENGSFAHGNGATATGDNSYAGGQDTVAGGAHSHAGGYESEAGGENAFAHGEKVYAYGKNQTVFGQYNKEDPDALFIVGGGDSEENRKNLFVVKKDGSIVGLNTSNALTKTVSGEVIRVDDASPIEHEMNVKVRNKNLIPTPYGTSSGDYVIGQAYAKSGVDFTMNEDGSVTLNGTATANIFFSLTTPSLALPDGSYTLSGGYKDANNNRVAMCVRDPSDTIMASGSGPATFSTQTKGNIAKEFYLYAYSGSTFDNVTLYPQLEEGITATAYTPYIEDISTVKVKKYGKNLFKATESKEHRGITFELLNDGTYHVYGTNDGTGHSAIEMYLVLPAGKYTGSGCPSGGSQTTYHIKFVNLTTNEQPVDYGNGAEFETTATQRIMVQLMVRSGQTVDLIFKPMIEAGTGDKVYEPYIEPIEYPVSADGTVEDVTSIYPTTTLITDTAGAVIDCTYNRDINRVLDDTGFMYDHNPVSTGSFSMNRKVGSDVGDYSFTEGYSATAAGRYSHAGGEASQAKGVGSFAHGQRVTADADYQATFGTYNEVNTNAALIVGNGNGITKSNAFEVQKEGNAFVKGSLYVGGTGSTQASAKPVATQDSVSTMEQRINNLENITSSMGGVFFEDADVAYVKTIPENVAPYASLNKVGGLGIYQKKLVNLIPSTYDTANGTVSGYHTFNSNADGVITIVDRTPVEEWTSESWFNAEISLNTIELPAGTYTAAIYADNPEGSPFGLYISGGDEDIRVGGAWGWEYAESPVTFVLTETTWLNIALKFDCGGSAWVPTGDVEVCHFRVMLNEGDEAIPWEPYSENAPAYIEPPKVTSIDITGKNLLDYGGSRVIESGNPGEAETRLIIKDDSMCYVDTHYIPVEAGPGSEYTEVLTMNIDSINSSIVYPAGTYSVGNDIPCNVWSGGVAYLVLSAKTVGTQQFVTIRGNNNIISEPFTISYADIVYAPEQLTASVYGIEVPLMLVKSAEAPLEPIPFKRDTIQIPQSIISREDYGLGVNHGTEIYSNYINFERQVYVKRCLSVDLEDQMTYLSINGTKINDTVLLQTIQCSHPGFTFDVYSDGPGSRTLYAWKDGSWEGVSEYITQEASEGRPVKVFFGTNLTEEIDISAELIGIDNYIPVEAGGLIIFNNDQQADVPSTIEYQSMMQEGETE